MEVITLRTFMLTLLALLVSVAAVLGQGDPAQVARGKYLAESVGLCQDCHTPKLETGELDKTKWMKGSTLDFALMNPIPKWHKMAPDLTPSGNLFKRWGPDGLVKFMEAGKNPKGGGADPPMPAYRFSHEDAVALVEYLKTLN